jgi:hypothetical protein
MVLTVVSVGFPSRVDLSHTRVGPALRLWQRSSEHPLAQPRLVGQPVSEPLPSSSWPGKY